MDKLKKVPVQKQKTFASIEAKAAAEMEAVREEAHAQTRFENLQLRYALAQANAALGSLQMEMFGPQIQAAAQTAQAAARAKNEITAAPVKAPTKG